MRVIVLYNGEFGERVLGNLINSPGFCDSCDEGCTQCMKEKYTAVEDIVAVVEMPDPDTLEDFTDIADRFITKVQHADIALVINVHSGLLLEMLPILKEAGIKGIVGCSERPKEMPQDLRKQIENKAAELGIETAFAKPFCAIKLDTSKPHIAAFLQETMIGEPKIKIVLQRDRNSQDTIVDAKVDRSTPCGSTWFIAKRLLGLKPDQPDFREIISKAHRTYPCTASMDVDSEIGDTILHKAECIAINNINKDINDAVKSESSYKLSSYFIALKDHLPNLYKKNSIALWVVLFIILEIIFGLWLYLSGIHHIVDLVFLIFISLLYSILIGWSLHNKAIFYPGVAKNWFPHHLPKIVNLNGRDFSILCIKLVCLIILSRIIVFLRTSELLSEMQWLLQYITIR